MYNTFKFFTNTLKAVKDDNGARYITGIASSTGLDRDNDRMSESALHTMKSTAEANLTIFTNHEYKVPDDLFGSCVEATVKAQKNKEPITIKSDDDQAIIETYNPQELEVKIKVVSDAVNPKAGQLYKAIEEGVNLGFSIGGKVKKAATVIDAITEKAINLIESIDLYEISIVSIPANPEAMNLAIAKSIHGNKVTEASKDEIEEIISRTKSLNPEVTMEGVHEYLLKELKKYYDECCEVGYDAYYDNRTPAEKKEDEMEEEREEREYAKCQAENVLLRSGMSLPVGDDDDDVIHLRSHAWAMDDAIYFGNDTTELMKHIKKHLTRLKNKISEDSNE